MNEPHQTPTAIYPRLYEPPVDEDAQAAVDFAEFAAIPQACALFEPPPSNDAVATNPLFVPSYLVVLIGVCEDAPVGLFMHAEEAVEFARDVRDNPDAHAKRYFDAMGRSESTRNRRWLNVAVVEFSGPVPMDRIELFELD